MTTNEKLRAVREYKQWKNEDIMIILNVSKDTVKSWFRFKNPNNPNKWITEKIEAWYTDMSRTE